MPRVRIAEPREGRPLVEPFAALARHRRVWFLDSARRGPLGRWSFLGLAEGPPIVAHRTEDARFRLGGLGPLRLGDPLAALREAMAARRLDLALGPDVPFGSGFVGVLGYELARAFTPELRRPPGSGRPDLALLAVDHLWAEDHATGRLLEVAIGEGPTLAAAEAAARRRLTGELPALEAAPPGAPPSAEWRGSHDDTSYRAMVEAARAHIAAGDAFEICVTRRFSTRFTGSAVDLYLALRAENPAPYGAYLDLGELQVLSSSPERFLTLDRERRVESRPIKGTVRRAGDDAAERAALLGSPKDRAENLMIVDLVRSDLGRVADYGTVDVPALLSVETLPSVHQLVSTVVGRLADDRDAIDLLRATFPGGSMTGAPKLEAMRIIERLEPEERGIYSGALGYFDDLGGLDLAMVIRTFVRHGDELSTNAGGAVVLDSDPEAEEAESRLKVAALFGALARLDAPRPAPKSSHEPPHPRPAARRAIERRSRARVLVVDHFDSFTHNLAHLLAELGAEPLVHRADRLDLAGAEALAPDAIVLSPGPGHPRDPERVGVTPALVERFGPSRPILGVCLGHQAIAAILGGTVSAARRPLHGADAEVHHEGSHALFAGLPQPFRAMRYHSLVVSALPESLAAIAWSGEGEIMALAHRRWPLFGVQFHPESIGTAYGRVILSNFLGFGRSA